MQVVTNRPADRFLMAQVRVVGPGRRRRSSRRVRRDFGIRPQPGSGVPSGSRFGRGFDDRFAMSGTRAYRTGAVEFRDGVPFQVAAGPGLEVVSKFNGMGALGIGSTETFLLQTLVGGLATFGGSLIGTKLGVSAALATATQTGGSTSPAVNSLLADAAKAAGLEETAKALVKKPTVKKKPLTTTTKVAIGAGIAAVAGLAFAIL